VEVLIAISLLTLAVELARDVEQPTILRRSPWAMAVAFGLLHGFRLAVYAMGAERGRVEVRKARACAARRSNVGVAMSEP
jgi:hypothetical protein